jgi:hypothetical protein
MPDTLEALSDFIAAGLSAQTPRVAEVISPLFGSRYNKRHWDASSKNGVRDAYGLSDADGIPFGALIHPDNPPSGAYGGLAWLVPSGEGESNQSGCRHSRAATRRGHPDSAGSIDVASRHCAGTLRKRVLPFGRRRIPLRFRLTCQRLRDIKCQAKPKRVQRLSELWTVTQASYTAWLEFPSD